MSHTYSPSEVRQMFKDEGVTVTEWAAARGYSRRLVYAVIAGKAKGDWGQAHDIAVALGMKPRPTGSLNAQGALSLGAAPIPPSMEKEPS